MIDGGDATIIVATIGGIAAVLAALTTALGFAYQAFVKRKEGTDPRTVQFYTAGQESLLKALEQAGVDREQDRADIVSLRAEVARMRSELAEALHHARECDEARVLQDTEIRMLREIVEGRQP